MARGATTGLVEELESTVELALLAATTPVDEFKSNLSSTGMYDDIDDMLELLEEFELILDKELGLEA